MLVVYAATFAGFVIFLVQFIDTFTTVSLVHVQPVSHNPQLNTASCASLLLHFVLACLLCTIPVKAHDYYLSDCHRITAHGISNTLHCLCGT